MSQPGSTGATLRRDWFSNIRGDVLAGIVVALALIPEAIGFSIIPASAFTPRSRSRW